jgi:hypothetical protein
MPAKSKTSQKKTKKGTHKKPTKAPKKSIKKSTKGKKQQKSLEKDVWIINPESGRLIQVGKNTYEDLVKRKVVTSKTTKYYIKRGPVPWEQIAPKSKVVRRDMFAKHPEMFMLWPKSRLHDPSLNQDDEPKYPIATAEKPGVVNCHGVQAALRRVHMDKASIANPKRQAHIIKQIKKVLDTHCRLQE